MKQILNFIFGKRKDGKCRSWDHDYGPLEKLEYLASTGKYIGNQPVTQKYFYHKEVCKKCGHVSCTDILPSWS